MKINEYRSLCNQLMIGGIGITLLCAITIYCSLPPNSETPSRRSVALSFLVGGIGLTLFGAGLTGLVISSAPLPSESSSSPPESTGTEDVT